MVSRFLGNGQGRDCAQSTTTNEAYKLGVKLYIIYGLTH
jgi:hypothetical protein